MAHFALLCPEDAGHVLSNGALGSELVRRGHRVTLVARPAAAAMAEQLQLEFYPLQTDHVPLRFPHLQWAAMWPFGCSGIPVLRWWIRWQSELTLRCVPAALRALAVDGLLIDQTVVAGGTVAEHLSLPFVTICSALLWHEELPVPPLFTGWPFADNRRSLLRNRAGYAAWHWFFRPTLRLVNRFRRGWQLRPWRRLADGFSALAQVSQLCPEFDFPRRELPANFHYIGSLAANRPVPPDKQFAWERLDGRPLVFGSLGTVPDPRNLPVFRRILAACAGLPAQLVLALGKWTDDKTSVRDRLGPIPDNALVSDFAPQLALLDRASLLITHAGVNTVLEALSRGVPMVALPRTGDQWGMAARIAHAGAGLRASFFRSTPAELRGLVRRVLADDAFRERARDLQQALRTAGGAERAATIAEQALLTRRPVLRP